MNEKTLKLLEFDRIRTLLASRAGSRDAKQRCADLVPMSSLAEIEDALTRTQDGLDRLFRSGSISFSGIKDIRPSLRRLDAGGILDQGELLGISSLLGVCARVKRYGDSLTKDDGEGDASDSLTALFSMLQPLSAARKRIEECIISEEEIADDASPGLRDVRRKIHQAGDRIREHLNRMVNGSLRTYLQDAVITMRHDRYCLPVKAEYKNRVPGMIHDQSSSGSTFFIEPESVVRLNNELKELYMAEEQEIQKVLASLSELISPHTEEISMSYTALTELDFIFACSQLAMDMNATRPLYSEDRVIELRRARHPLLDKKTVVPVDIRLGEDYRLLVITGPNTGGKTVSLKTCGLLGIMGQCGLFIPCADRSRLPVFDDIYADIGDEQSIEQSLSTFSSHMKNIISILKKAGESSLCLFDELCAGTDPTEGAALAIAILEEIYSRGGLCMATTHYSELKLFALTREGVMNGSCEFDVKTLSPTYRLLVGIPGKSNAFAISGKLGLSESIISEAKKHLSESDKSFEDVIASLEKARMELEREQERAEEMRRQAQSYKDRSRSGAQKLEDQTERILSEARQKARAILQEAKDTADETIRNFQKYGSIENIREMEKDREKLRNSLKKVSDTGLKEKIYSDDDAARIDPSKLKKGDEVRVVTMNVNGIVSTLPDERGNLFVHCGILRSQVNVKDLAPAVTLSSTGRKNRGGKTPGAFGKSGRTTAASLSKAATISGEVMLIGMTVDEAIARLDKYLDDAYISNMTEVRIVHGKGTGALRAAVQKHLKKVKYVESFRTAEYGEGDAGVTIAVFKA